MNTISRIKTMLEGYPQLSFEVEDYRLAVEPPTKIGFSVWILVGDRGFTVGYDGWHDVFEDESSALYAFALGLSDQCRLKVFKRGKFEYKWEIEVNDGYEMDVLSTTGLIFFPFWRKMSEEYRQNHLIKKEELDAFRAELKDQ